MVEEIGNLPPGRALGGQAALVTDKDWIRHGVAAFGWLSPGELRVFEPGSGTRLLPGSQNPLDEAFVEGDALGAQAQAGTFAALPGNVVGGLLERSAADVRHELPTPLPDVQEEVGFGGIRIEPVEALAPYRSDGWFVDLFEPVGGNLGGVERISSGEHGVIAVKLDRLEQLDIADRTVEPDREVGSCPVEAAFLHEDPLLLGVYELDDVGVGTETPACSELGDFGVDRLHPALPGDRDTMVTVEDEVGLAELIDDDRREVAGWIGILHLTPARADLRATRKEVAVEVSTAAVRTDDVVQRDRTNADVPSLKRTKAPGRLLEREQRRRRFPADDACQAPVGASSARPLKAGGSVHVGGTMPLATARRPCNSHALAMCVRRRTAAPRLESSA